MRRRLSSIVAARSLLAMSVSRAPLRNTEWAREVSGASRAGAWRAMFIGPRALVDWGRRIRLATGAIVLATIALALGNTSCGGNGGPESPSQCSLTCRAQTTMRADVPSISLSCGTNPVSCENTFDQFARIISMTCTYANGRRVTCTNITYNNLGQMTGGSCTGEGQTCRLP